MGYVPAHVDIHAPGRSTPREVMFVLHGILGSASNWRSLSRRLVAAHPDWMFALVDHRNHGDSTGALPPHTVDACARDLADLARDLDIAPSIVCGHSFGGKVALAYARDYADDLDEVWFLDSQIGANHPGDDTSNAEEIQVVIEALRSVRMPLPSRMSVTTILKERGLSPAIAQWMTTNLKFARDGYRWRFELDAVQQMIDDYFRVDLWDLIDEPPPHLTVHGVKAERSARISAEDEARFNALARSHGRGELHILKDAGHWVHVDNPDGLFELLSGACARVAKRLH